MTHVLDLKGYQLGLEFNDGRVKDLDLRDELYSEFLEQLKDVDLIKNVDVNPDNCMAECPFEVLGKKI